MHDIYPMLCLWHDIKQHHNDFNILIWPLKFPEDKFQDPSLSKNLHVQKCKKRLKSVGVGKFDSSNKTVQAN